jgi:S-DNA-T family DNA segregation ATPase FtsK/SpoIIIE
VSEFLIQQGEGFDDELHKTAAENALVSDPDDERLELGNSPEEIAEDPLYPDALKIVREAKKASASLLQRRLKIGYARAARLLDIMESRGVVGPGKGAKPREVYNMT